MTYTAKVIAMLVNAQSVEVTRNAYTLTGENIEMLDAEGVNAVNEFVAQCAKKYGSLKSHVLVLEHSTPDGASSIDKYFLKDGENVVTLTDPETLDVFTISIPKEEEKNMLNLTDEMMAKVIHSLTGELINAKINPSDAAAAMSFLMGNQDMVMAKVKEIEAAAAQRSLPVNVNQTIFQEFLEFLKEHGFYADAYIRGGLMNFVVRGGDHKTFAMEIFNHFGQLNTKEIGDFFRAQLGVDNSQRNLLKTSVYVTADATRATGNAIETAVTTVVKAINKYGFQWTAKMMEKTVGGRPEVIQGHNFVEDAVKQTAAKVRAKRDQSKTQKESK